MKILSKSIRPLARSTRTGRLLVVVAIVGVFYFAPPTAIAERRERTIADLNWGNTRTRVLAIMHENGFTAIRVTSSQVGDVVIRTLESEEVDEWVGRCEELMTRKMKVEPGEVVEDEAEINNGGITLVRRTSVNRNTYVLQLSDSDVINFIALPLSTDRARLFLGYMKAAAESARRMAKKPA